MSKIYIISNQPKILQSKINSPERIVFGNLGPDNTHSISSTNETLLGNNFYMIGFNTGNSSRLKLSHITIYSKKYSGDGVQAGLYANSNNLPGTLLQNSNNINSEITSHTAPKKIRLSFNNYSLSPSTTYWIGLNTLCSWYYELEPETYTSYNDSGYTLVGKAKSQTGLNGPWSSWDPNLGGIQLSLSIEAY